MIFLTIDTFSCLSFLSLRVDGAHAIVKIKKAICFVNHHVPGLTLWHVRFMQLSSLSFSVTMLQYVSSLKVPFLFYMNLALAVRVYRVIIVIRLY